MNPGQKAYTGERKLRYAVMCNGGMLQTWQIKCLEHLRELDFTEAVLVISNAEKEKPKSFLQKTGTYPYQLLLYTLFKKVHKLEAQHAQPLPEFLHKTERIDCITQKKGKYSEYFSAEDIAKIKSLNVDFIIRFGFNIIRGEILNIAPYGVWSFHHGDETRFRGGPPAFWEVYQNEKVCGAILQRLTNKLDGGIVLKKGFIPVTNHSYHATLDHVYNLSSSWIKQVCIDIQYGNAVYLQGLSSTTNAKIYTYPHNLIMAAFAFKKLGRKIRFHWEELFRPESWSVGLIQNEAGFEPGKKLSNQIIWFKHPKKDSYYADGFATIKEHFEYLFVEEYSYKKGKGFITAIDLNTKKTEILIEETHHLSYPFSFIHEDKIFILPEAAGSGKVMLYEVKPHENRIVRKIELLNNVHAYDPTLIQHNGKWWLFVTKKETDSNTCLHIYYADALTGPYTEHANNPVKTDVQSARPAGNIFTLNGNLFRPSQNCSVTYGGSIVINRIITLNEYMYVEEKHDEIMPDQVNEKAIGIHTLNSQIPLVAFDLKRSRFNWPNFRRKLAKKLRIMP